MFKSPLTKPTYFYPNNPTKTKQEISFLAKKKKTYDFFQSKSGDQITKIAGFVGANASEKTNIMRLFSFLRYFVCESSKSDSLPGPEIVFKTFFNNNKKSNFYIEFENGNSIYFYEFSVKENKIINEILSVKRIKKGSKKTEVFSRQLNNTISMSGIFFKDFPKNFMKNIRQDVSLIAFLKSHYSIDIIDDVFGYFARMETNINERGQINNPIHQVKTIDFYEKNNVIKKEIEDFIRHFDVGLETFEIKKETKDNEVKMSISGIHTSKEKNNKLDFSYESRGTQSLFFTIANILKALKNNSVVIIDEMEFGFHPEALSKLIGYFINENKDGKAQIIFSSHSLGFMNRLDMHQIFLTEKDVNGASIAYRLNKVEGIRTDENFFSKYMTGAYGAFPKIEV